MLNALSVAVIVEVDLIGSTTEARLFKVASSWGNLSSS